MLGTGARLPLFFRSKHHSSVYFLLCYMMIISTISYVVAAELQSLDLSARTGWYTNPVFMGSPLSWASQPCLPLTARPYCNPPSSTFFTPKPAGIYQNLIAYNPDMGSPTNACHQWRPSDSANTL